MRKAHLISGLLFFALFLASGRHMGRSCPRLTANWMACA